MGNLYMKKRISRGLVYMLPKALFGLIALLHLIVARPVKAYPPKDNLAYCYYCNGDHVIDETDFGYMYMYDKNKPQTFLWDTTNVCPNKLCEAIYEDTDLLKPAGLLDSTGIGDVDQSVEDDNLITIGENKYVVLHDEIPLCYRCHTINASQVEPGTRAVNSYLTEIKCDYCHTRKRYDFGMLDLNTATKRYTAQIPGDTNNRDQGS